MVSRFPGDQIFLAQKPSRPRLARHSALASALGGSSEMPVPSDARDGIEAAASLMANFSMRSTSVARAFDRLVRGDGAVGAGQQLGFLAHATAAVRAHVVAESSPISILQVSCRWTTAGPSGHSGIE